MSAFKKYLRSLTPEQSCSHLIDCLRHPDSDAAWQLFAEVCGDDWTLNRESMASVIKDIYQTKE